MSDVVDISSIGSAITTVGARLAKRTFSDLLTRMLKAAAESASKRALKVFDNSRSTFEPHIRATFDRCTKIKTLLNRDQPVELLSQYVNIKFYCGGTAYDDYDLIEEIWRRRRVIVSGQGGGGKTVFMKYLWIAFFENPKGRVPIFVELRRLNDIATVDLLLFIYHSIVGTHATISREDFDRGIGEGLFIFLLDGFDEIVNDKRAELEKQILALSHNSPQSIVVVSGRSDERFNAWQAFSNLSVLRLTKEQIIELITKLKYDAQIKKKFIQRIKSDLYRDHSSFLSSPLLATMMLLTFDQFADIPQKIHLFYEQAFDTLFAKHDATKEAFKRTMHSGLPIDVFKKYLSYFCLTSYYEEKFEFTQDEVIEYIGKGLKIERAPVDPDKLLLDLTESVCTLQRDGLRFVFTHRSFQEFFAAYCLARVASKHIGQILPHISQRTTDSVISMLYEMNSDLVENEYVLPGLTALSRAMENVSPKSFLIDYVSLREIQIEFGIPMYGFAVESENNYYVLSETLSKLYPAVFRSLEKRLVGFKKKDRDILSREFKDSGLRKARKRDTQLGYTGRIVVEDGKFVWKLAGREGPADWMANTGYAEFCSLTAEVISNLGRDIEKRRNNKAKALEELFGLPQSTSGG